MYRLANGDGSWDCGCDSGQDVEVEADNAEAACAAPDEESMHAHLQSVSCALEWMHRNLVQRSLSVSLRKGIAERCVLL